MKQDRSLNRTLKNAVHLQPLIWTLTSTIFWGHGVQLEVAAVAFIPHRYMVQASYRLTKYSILVYEDNELVADMSEREKTPPSLIADSRNIM